ncbi:hypothetical protein GXW82_39180 [Streptacidiphilus sp. 4-A2]|nr:hypothetical protein [Streptacidiphilus sp. 4-A2]
MLPSAELPDAHSFEKLMDAAERSAVHLEMRDVYEVDASDEDFQHWRRTGRRREDPEYWSEWSDLIGRATARGVSVRRARIVSEPVTEYIRFEHAGTDSIIAAGEAVRWTPRRNVSDIALPGNDFWLFDDRVVRFGFFSGDGSYTGEEWTELSAVVRLCTAAFAAVWERGVAHEEYKV